MQWHDLLSSGDVDAVRRMLRHGSAESDNEVAERSKTYAGGGHGRKSTLFADRMQLKVCMGGEPLAICSYRTMGKVLWPAGHAVAKLLACSPCHARTADHKPHLLEFGAGCAVPSLVAAAGPYFEAVLATDCFEENVQLIVHNSKLNGNRLKAAMRLDVSDHQMLASIVHQHEMHDKPLLLLACDMSYDPEAVTNLFVSTGVLMQQYSTAQPMLLFARSDNFAHLDDHTARAARDNGLTLLARKEVRAAGIQDAIGVEHLTPCAEDAVTLFFWAPLEHSIQKAVFAWLLSGECDTADQAMISQLPGKPTEAKASMEDPDVWAPMTRSSLTES